MTCKLLQDTLLKYFTAVFANEYLVSDNMILQWAIWGCQFNKLIANFLPNFHLTGIYFWRELQYIGPVGEQNIKCRPVKTREITHIRLLEELYDFTYGSNHSHKKWQKFINIQKYLVIALVNDINLYMWQSIQDQVKFVEDIYLSRPYSFKFFKVCLPQILLGLFLNTSSHIFFGVD